MLLVIFLVVSVLAVVRAKLDSIIIARNEYVSHTENAIVTVLTGAIAALFTGVTMFLFVLCTHWLVFDLALNGFRGLPLNYTGSSVTDRFLKKYQLGFMFKCVLIILTGILYDTTI
jgi:hypothetical protein